MITVRERERNREREIHFFIILLNIRHGDKF